MSFIRLIPLSLAILVSACATTPPSRVDNACAIFNEKDDWYADNYKVFKEYSLPVHVQLAIIHQESRFKYDAKPDRTKLLWFVPWTRKSSAFGYAQVKDETWEWYQEKTGRHGADRDDYYDAARFIGWYADMAHRKLGISKWDAYSQYLAYHEGLGGYQKKSYNKKPWLIDVAKKVRANASRYAAQMKKCEDDLDKGWSLWPF